MLDTLAQSWLSLQCQMIPNADKGLVVLGLIPGDGFEPTASWPEGDTATPGLMDTARLAMTRKASVVSDQASAGSDRKDPGLVVAYPLVRDGQPFGVVAVQIQGVPEQQQAVLQLLRWGIGLAGIASASGSAAPGGQAQHGPGDLDRRPWT